MQTSIRLSHTLARAPVPRLTSMFIARDFAPSRHTLLCIRIYIYIYINDISKWLWRPIFWHSAPKTLIIVRRMWFVSDVFCVSALLGFLQDIANSKSNTWVNLFNEYNIIYNLSLVWIRFLLCRVIILFHGGPICMKSWVCPLLPIHLIRRVYYASSTLRVRYYQKI
jgi:hypothetical protein